MSEAAHEDRRASANPAVDPAALVRELRRQISAVREQMEAHRETMLAAGLIAAAPREEPSWAPRGKPDEPTPLDSKLPNRRGTKP